MSMTDFIGFDAYDLTGDPDDLTPYVPGRNGGVAWERIGTGEFTETWDLYTGITESPSSTHLVVGFALRLGDDGTWTAAGQGILDIHSSGGQHLGLISAASGGVEIWTNPFGGGSLLGSFALASTDTDVWSYIELIVDWGSSGAIHVRVNEVEVLALTGIDTAIHSQADGVRLLNDDHTGSDSPWLMLIDDVYVLNEDDTDGLHYVDYLGDMQSHLLIRRADGDYTDWINPSHPHWNLNPLAIGNYIPEEPTPTVFVNPPYADTFLFLPLPDLDAVAGLRVYTDTGISNDGTYHWTGATRFIPGAGQPGTTADAGNYTASGTGHQDRSLLSYNPMRTGIVGWTAAEINAMQAGPVILTAGQPGDPGYPSSEQPQTLGKFEIEYLQKTPKRGGRRNTVRLHNAYSHN